MATRADLTEDFTGGAPGVTVATTSSVFDSITGTAPAPVFFDASPGDVSKAMRAVTTAASTILRADTASAALLWVQFYLWLETIPDGNTAIINWKFGTLAVGDFRILSTGLPQLRDNITAMTWSPAPTALAVGEWHRVDIKIQPGSATGHRVNIYSGANLHSTSTTSQTSGDRPATAGAQTTVDNIRIGVLTAVTTTLRIARLRGDDAVPPTPVVTGGGATVNAGPDQTGVEPRELVTLSATVTGTGTTVFTQTAGVPVTLSGAGPNRTYIAPATMAADTQTFSVSHGAATPDSVSVAVKPHLLWRKVSAGVFDAVFRTRSSGTGTSSAYGSAVYGVSTYGS